jgi:hypothetical protein
VEQIIAEVPNVSIINSVNTVAGILLDATPLSFISKDRT